MSASDEPNAKRAKVNYKVLVPDNVHQSAIDILKNTSNFDVVANGKLSQEELLKQAPEFHAMVIRSGVKLTPEVLNAASNLKAVARAGVGVDNIDLDAATKNGVIVMNTPAGNTISTAEHTFGLMLALARNLPQGDASLREGKWERKLFMGTELNGKTLGVVGFGRIGQAVAQRARAFGMKIVAFDPYLPKHVFGEQEAADVTLDELFAQSDFITLHTIVTEQTTRMINAEAIKKMKKGVRIVNAARGVLIDDNDLAAALTSGHVAGAALDVFTSEPPKKGENPLIAHAKVIHTPHLAASTTEAQIAVAQEAANLIIATLNDNKPANCVNRAVLEEKK